MFIINPSYQTPKLTESQKQKKILQIQSILFIPSNQRKDDDKRILYQYFIDNPYLKEIQNAKSLRARILCVGQLQIISKEQYLESKLSETKSALNFQQGEGINHYKKNKRKFLVFEKFKHDSSVAVLDQAKKHQILMQNQDQIRQKMIQFKRFSFAKKFLYHEQLYLAHFIKNTGKTQFKYKQFVFKESQNTDYVYFIEEGEFQVFKNIQFAKEKFLTKSLEKNKSKKQVSPLKKYLENLQSPYRKKQVKIIKQELAKIQGDSGQCFGQAQIFLQKQKRLYSLRSNTLSSKVFKISYKYFKQIFQYNKQLFNQLKNQYKNRYSKDLQKINGNKYSKQGVISINNSRIQNMNAVGSLNHVNYSSNNSKLSQIILSMDRYKTLEGTLQSQGQLEGTFTLPNNTISITINDRGADKSLSRKYKMYSQIGKKSENKRYKNQRPKQVKTSTNKYSKSIQVKDVTFDTPFFPVINKRYLQKKEQNNNNPQTIGIAKRRQKVKGLIDIETIINQKQQLFDSKSKAKIPQFSFYKLDEKNTKRINFLKRQLQQTEIDSKSPAHSKQYMKNLIKHSLRKSGYEPQNALNNYKNNVSLEGYHKQLNESMVKPSSISNIDSYVNQMPPDDISYDNILSKEDRTSLVSNDFDQFFHKI